MIQKPNSLDLMDRFEKSEKDIKSLKNDLNLIVNRTNTKLSIINICNEYNAFMVNNLELIGAEAKSKKIIFPLQRECILNDDYEIYGQTIHGRFLKMPENAFSFLSETGPLFKSNAIVEFYETGKKEDTLDYKFSYNNILKHENDLSKEDVFHVFKSDKITMSVTFQMGAIGGFEANMFELCPYLPGSFDITSIRIFTVEQYYKEGKDVEFPEIEITKDYKNVGAMRDIFEKTKIYKIEFDFKLNYKNNGYPFGLKHFYLLKADYNIASEIIIEVEMNDYIEAIEQNYIIIKANGESTVPGEYFMYYTEGVLTIPISNPVSRNITKFYTKIPLENKALIGAKFDNVILR